MANQLRSTALGTLCTLTALLPMAMPPASAAAACSARSTAGITPVVELYTSEGCSSCPPADQWLSRMKDDPDLVALAFHVDYWDRLGWKDRFGSAENTRRQAQQHASSGAGFSYTPQVIVDGVDRKNWPALATSQVKAARAMAPVDVSLQRDGDRFTATVAPRAGTPIRLAAYWAVTEQGHVSTVKAGENQGSTLHHDFVVREYQPVAAWATRAEAPTSLSFEPALPADPAHPRQVNLVIVDVASGRPVQAIKLGC